MWENNQVASVRGFREKLLLHARRNFIILGPQISAKKDCCNN